MQHTTRAHEAWSILASQYETRNYTRIQNLENQLVEEKLPNGEKVESFVKRIKDLQDQLAVVGVVVSPEDMAHRCIRVLPSKYDGIVTTLNTQVRPTPLKFDELSAMLLEEELRLKTREGKIRHLSLGLRVKGHPIQTNRIVYQRRRSSMDSVSTVTRRVTQSRIVERR